MNWYSSIRFTNAKAPEQAMGESVPSLLYHHTSPDKRQSIFKNGLKISFDKTGFGGIFLIDVPDMTSDTWQVDTNGLSIVEDHTWDAEGVSWICYDDIPPNRLKLLTNSV